jgi:hypothetical protein
MLKIKLNRKFRLGLFLAVFIIPTGAIAATQPNLTANLAGLLLGDNAGLDRDDINPLVKLGQNLVGGSSVGVAEIASSAGLKIYRADGGLDLSSILGGQGFDGGLLNLSTQLFKSNQPLDISTLRTIAANNAIAGSAEANSKAAERIAVSTQQTIVEGAEVYKSVGDSDPESSLEALGQIKQTTIANSLTTAKLAQSNLLNAKTSELSLLQSMEAANDKRVDKIMNEIDVASVKYQERLGEYQRNARYADKGLK